MDTKATPAVPFVHDEMDAAMFNAIMQKGLAQAKAGLGLDIDDAFAAMEHNISDMRAEGSIDSLLERN